jgi:hypothetical protein
MGSLNISENGYGDFARKMADDLRKASAMEEAGQIARDHGLRDAEDAADWLRERSEP